MFMKAPTYRLIAIVTLVLSSALLAATIRDGKTAPEDQTQTQAAPMPQTAAVQQPSPLPHGQQHGGAEAPLAFTTARNVGRDKALIMQNALTQGYWIARSLEIGHRMMVRDHAMAQRDIIIDIEKHPNVRLVVILDAAKHVLLASDTTREGRRWPDAFAPPPETGSIIRRDWGNLVLAFPASFVRASQSLQHHADTHGALDRARWILPGLDASEARAHYYSIVLQSVAASGSVLGLVLAGFACLSIMQRYQLASASLAKLTTIKHHLARFVPVTVQKLIEANPEHPALDKVECEVSVLFLDIEQYTTLSADMAPEALNDLIERYFSAFLDVVLSHGGEINETAGDGIMAISRGRRARPTPSTRSKPRCASRNRPTY